MANLTDKQIISNFKWNLRFMYLAQHVSQWSKDPSTKVGAVAVDAQRIVLGLGYNGFPRKVQDRLADYQDREIKLQKVIHAEMNAILNASVKDVTGAVLYLWPFMSCSRCAGMIIQAGIAEVVVPFFHVTSPYGAVCQRWASDTELAKLMYAEAGVKVTEIGIMNGDIPEDAEGEIYDKD